MLFRSHVGLSDVNGGRSRAGNGDLLLLLLFERVVVGEEALQGGERGHVPHAFLFLVWTERRRNLFINPLHLYSAYPTSSHSKRFTTLPNIHPFMNTSTPDGVSPRRATRQTNSTQTLGLRTDIRGVTFQNSHLGLMSYRMSYFSACRFKDILGTKVQRSKNGSDRENVIHWLNKVLVC